MSNFGCGGLTPQSKIKPTALMFRSYGTKTWPYRLRRWFYLASLSLRLLLNKNTRASFSYGPRSWDKCISYRLLTPREAHDEKTFPDCCLHTIRAVHIACLH